MEDSDERLAQEFRALHSKQMTILSQIQLMELQASELTLLETLEPTRKCFRIINNISVPRTVKEVKPQLEVELTKLREALMKQTKAREEIRQKLSEIGLKLDPEKATDLFKAGAAIQPQN